MMRRLLVAVLLVATLGLRVASASTFLQFTELAFSDPFVFAAAGGTTTITATNVPVFVTFDPAVCLVVGCGGVTPGIFRLDLMAATTGPVTIIGGTDVQQPVAGTLAITNGLVNLLTITFTDALTGSLGGSSPTLAASEPPDLFSGTSTVIDPVQLGIPRGFALSFSDLSPGLFVTGGTVGSGRADATGTFSASRTVVPEPGTGVVVTAGLLLLATVYQLRRRR